MKNFIETIKAFFALIKQTPEEICSECYACGTPYCGESCEHFGTIKD